MNLGEQIRNRPGIAASVVLIIVGIAIAVGFFLRNSSGLIIGRNGPRQWYTVDDGKTYFAGPGDQYLPFEKDGKTAYGCNVYSTKDGKTRWVADLYRYKAAPRQTGHRPLPRESLLEVKRPGTGDTGWVSATSPRGLEIQSPVSPAGDKTNVVPVFP